MSTLATVWTNALVGIALAGVSPWQWAVLPVVLGLSLAYLGGMYLNDAFDHAIDAQDRPSRPIPSGAIDANTVFTLGFALLLAAVATLAAKARGFAAPSEAAMLGALAPGGAIIGYNWNHKGNRFSPLTMAVCRLLAHVVAGLAATAMVPGPLLTAGGVSLCYLVDLTHVAKRESLGRLGSLWPLLLLGAPLAYGAVLAGGPAGLCVVAALAGGVGVALWLLRRRGPGDIPRAVVSLIAGISLVDALFLAVDGWPGAAALAIACFAATLLLQRWISGT